MTHLQPVIFMSAINLTAELNPCTSSALCCLPALCTPRIFLVQLPPHHAPTGTSTPSRPPQQ